MESPPLAQILNGIGWQQPAEWLTATIDRIPANWQQPAEWLATLTASIDRVLENWQLSAEWLAATLALAYLLLAIRENPYAWPCAFLSAALYTLIFWQTNLPMQAALNATYMAIALYGWHQWHPPNKKSSASPPDKGAPTQSPPDKGGRGGWSGSPPDKGGLGGLYSGGKGGLHSGGLRGWILKVTKLGKPTQLKAPPTRGPQLKAPLTRGVGGVGLEAPLTRGVWGVYIRSFCTQQVHTTPPKIHRWPPKKHTTALTAIAIATVTSGTLLNTHTNAAHPYLDSFTAWASLLTTYMVARKILENWLYWIIINLVSIALYLSHALYPTAALFTLYLIIAIIGHHHWHQKWQQTK